MSAGADSADPALLSEVTALLSAYGHAIDRCDARSWAALFHPEGTSAGPGRPTLRGREDLIRWVEEHPRADVRHTCTNISVERIEGGRVHVASHFVIYEATPNGGRVAAFGSYADVLTRHEGRLVFWSRVAVAAE